MKEPRSIRAVLFDLDGTLLDTAPDLVAALNHVRESEGLPAVTVEDFRAVVPRGSAGLIQVGLPAGTLELNQARRARFLEHYARNCWVGTRPFDGVERMLECLQRAAVPWAIVTDKPEYLALPILERFGWARRAAGVVCGDTIDHRKPHPAPLLLACEISGVSPAHAVMVGDDARDLEAAKAAGIEAILAAYGYGAEAVLAAGFTGGSIVREPAELLDLLLPSA